MRGGEGEAAAVTDADPDAAAREPHGQIAEHRAVGLAGVVGAGNALLGLAEDVREREHPVRLSILIDVVGAERRDDVHGAARAGHADGEQPVAARLARATPNSTAVGRAGCGRIRPRR